MIPMTDTTQLALLQAPQLSKVTLCKLTTYSDRVLQTVQSTRYFSDSTRVYDWANGGTDRIFFPWLLRISDARNTMNHLPQPNGEGDENALRRTRRIVLRNFLQEDGSYLYQTLRAENIEFARIEIANLFLDRGVAGQGFRDLTAFSGLEQTWIYRGQVSQVLRVSDTEIELELVSELPQIPWVYADDEAVNDPSDLGARLPIVLGSAKRVECVGWTVGWTTTLAAKALAGAAILEFTDASGFAASGSSGIRVGSQLISWTGKTGNQLTGVSGLLVGQSAGQLCVEIITQGAWICNGVKSSAINDVYVLDPFTGAFTRVTTQILKTLADTATIPGRTVSTIRLTGSEIQSLLDSLAQVGQKPPVFELGSETRRATLDNGAVGGNGNAMRDGNLSTGDVNPTGTLLTWPAVNGRRVTEVTYRVYATLTNTQSLLFQFPTTSTTVNTITNNSGATVTQWWEWTTSNPAWCGTTMAFDCGNTSTIHQVERVEKYTGGPARRYETRVATSQVTSAHGSWSQTVDGSYTTGITSPAVQLGYHYTPVEGRLLVEVIHRAYLTLQNGDSWTLRTTSGGSNVFSADNATGADVTGWFEYATTVEAEMADDIYMTVTTGSTIFEVERIEVWEATESDVEIKSAKVGLGLRLFADVDGPAAEYDYAAGYSWDDTSGWTTATGTRTDEGTIKTEGSFSQKYVSSPGSPTLVRDCNNDAANWGSGDVSVANEGAITLAGGSLKVTTTAADSGGVSRTFSAQDFSSSNLRLGLYFVGSYFGAGSEVWVVLYGAAGAYREWHFGTADVLHDAWNLLELDLATADAGTGSGSMSSVTQINIFTNMGGTQLIGSILYVDEIYRIPVETCAVQRNATTGTLDLSADGNRYKLDVRGDGVDVGTTLRVYFSNTAGSGTTKPATYWYMDIASSELVNGSFVTIEKVASQFGSPATPNNVETIGFELMGTKIGTVYVDNLQKALATPTTDYSVAGGVLLDKIPDMIRYLLAEVCGLGHSVMDTDWDTLVGATYLDDNAHGVDLRVYGESTIDILSGLTFESRINILQDERSSGTVYRILASLDTYAWPTHVATITQWQSMAEEGKVSDEIWTRFRHLFQFRPELGEDAQAFANAVQTTVTSAETKYGRHDAPAVGFRSIEDVDTATEVAGYYEAERSRYASIYTITGVSWREGYRLERGDIVQFKPRWWSTNRKGRVLETNFRDDLFVDLKVVEVS